MNNQIIVPNVYNSSPDEFFDGSAYIPREIGDLKLLRKECRNQIVYYDWNLSFKDKTFASRPDNFGKDEIQIIFNINQKIDWQVDSAHETENMLPNGFDTVIGEGGADLSGGEQQRISIARCMLKDAPIVILDEATASVDADNEHFIQEAISELCRGKTLIVIAHRLNTIRNANKILVIKNGQIVESGTHEELMTKGGEYKTMVEKQTA